MTRKLALLATLVAALATVTAATLAVAKPKSKAKAKDQTTRLALPDGWQPEGIAAAGGRQFFVGSIPTGAVLKLNAKTGDTRTVVSPREGHAAIGLKAGGNERLFVAGGPTGKAFVYDARDDTELAAFQLAPAGEDTFVNDVALTRRSAYFTDSMRSSLYVVARDLSGFRELPLTGFTPAPGFNLNGIVAAGGGNWLLAVQSNTGTLWRIDPDTGAATTVDLGGATLTNGDGLLIKGKTLWVVENRDNQITVVRLSKKFTRGKVTDALTAGDDFDIPTTVARHGERLYAVNARFGTDDPASADYWVTVLRR